MKRIFISLFFLISLFSASALEKNYFVTAGPKLMLNTDDETSSAPSPFMYSLGLGCDFPIKDDYFFEAHGSMFTNYYLWDGEKAQPAEIENRTATAISLLLDFTCGQKWKVCEFKKHSLAVSGGLAFLLRFAMLSGDVESGDVDNESGNTAGEDLSSINSDFYSNLNFLYPEIAFSYTYDFSEKWNLGGELRTYIPISSLLTGDGIDSMIISLSAKLSFK